MRGILSYPETQPHDSGLFRRVIEFLVDRVGLDNTLDLLTCLLEAL
jgi:hypothetical protein